MVGLQVINEFKKIDDQKIENGHEKGDGEKSNDGELNKGQKKGKIEDDNKRSREDTNRNDRGK